MNQLSKDKARLLTVTHDEILKNTYGKRSSFSNVYSLKLWEEVRKCKYLTSLWHFNQSLSDLLISAKLLL